MVIIGTSKRNTENFKTFKNKFSNYRVCQNVKFS